MDTLAGVRGPWDEVGDGVFRRRYERWDQNIVLIDTSEGLVVVDSRSTHADARDLREELRYVSTSPVRYLVNTHFHWDHTFGNALFPDAVILGHRRCREQLVADGEATKVELSEADWIPAAMRSDYLEVVVTPPVVTFTSDASIHLGSRDIELVYLGRGHTDSDVVVLIDDVVIAGDLVEEGAPPSFGDSFPRAWLTTLDLLIERSAGPIVPGHGDVVDRSFVVIQRDEIAAAIAHLDGGGEPSPFPADVTTVIARRLEPL
jgi:glyoxylase-like metal-dependent hydrolase (beta-lactamase superfamily II)